MGCVYSVCGVGKSGVFGVCVWSVPGVYGVRVGCVGERVQCWGVCGVCVWCVRGVSTLQLFVADSTGCLLMGVHHKISTKVHYICDENCIQHVCS